MIDPETRFNEIIDALKSREYRLTPQRVELIRMIARSEGHPSAGMLYARIKDRFPTMSPATVYKTLALLKELNQVVEIDLPHDIHFDGNRPEPHPHLACLRCNTILDGNFTIEKHDIQHMEQETGFLVQRQQLVFFGLCSACQEKAE